MSKLVGQVFGNLRVTECLLDAPKHKQYACVCVACGTTCTKWGSVLVDKRHSPKCPKCGNKRITPEYWHFQSLDRIYTVRERLIEDAIKGLPVGHYSVWCTVAGEDYAQRLPHKDFSIGD